MNKRRIEIFVAGCPLCEAAVEEVRGEACPSCDVVVRDMSETAVAEQARELGLRSVPAVVIDGKIADCCAGRGRDTAVLARVGLGQPLP